MFGVFAIGEPMLADDLVVGIIPPPPPPKPKSRGGISIPSDHKPRKRTKRFVREFGEWKAPEAPTLDKPPRIPKAKPEKKLPTVKSEPVEFEFRPVTLESLESSVTIGEAYFVIETTPLEAMGGESALASVPQGTFRIMAYPLTAKGIVNPTDEELVMLVLELTA